MTERQSVAFARTEHTEDRVGRRGLLAWAATLAGAGLAWLSGTRSAEASHSGSGTPGADSQAVHVNVVNPTTARTFLLADIAGNPTLLGLNIGSSAFSMGVSDGVQGMTDKGGTSSGVHGRNIGANGIGVFGDAGVTGAGVVGSAGSSLSFITPPAAVGVLGVTNADNGMGVRGRIPSGFAPERTIGVYGENFSAATGGAPGAGGFGCYGFSANGHGLVGATGTSGGGAVVGATNGVAGAYAGIFYGPFVVVGGSKSAAVAHPDGSYRLLYCVESTESWFEDFGNATLANGKAHVNIDADFAAVADMSDYHVFLTPYGNTKGLHVARRTPMGFNVEEHDRGAGSLEFAWRVVAKRKDVAAARLAKVAIPPAPPMPSPPPPCSSDGPIVAAPRSKKHSRADAHAKRAVPPKIASPASQTRRP